MKLLMLWKRALIPLTSLLLIVCTAACSAAEPTPIPTPTLTAEQQTGKRVFAQECGSCHSVIDDAVIVGPSMVGVATRASGRVQGQDARTYLYGSILHPNDHVVEGFKEGLMPQTFGKQLTGEELDAVVAYLLTMEEGESDK